MCIRDRGINVLTHWCMCMNVLADCVGNFNTRSIPALHGLAAERLRRLSVANHCATDHVHHECQVSLWHRRQVLCFSFSACEFVESRSGAKCQDHSLVQVRFQVFHKVVWRSFQHWSDLYVCMYEKIYNVLNSNSLSSHECAPVGQTDRMLQNKVSVSVVSRSDGGNDD